MSEKTFEIYPLELRILQVTENYGEGLRYEVPNPIKMFVVQRYNGWFWGWSTIRSKKFTYSYEKFYSIEEAIKHIEQIKK